MEARTLAVAGVILLSLVVGAQIAYTTVGQPIGERWSSPATAVSVSGDDTRVLEVAAAGDADGGSVAWITRAGERYHISYARVTVEDGGVTIAQNRTVATVDRELQGLAVAVDGDDVAIAWERAKANDIVLYRASQDRTRVVSDDPLRAGEPAVALVGDDAVVGWQQWTGSGFAVELAVVSDGAVTYRSVDVVTDGAGSPTVDAAGDGFALTWFDAESQTVRTTFGTVETDGIDLERSRTLGRAQPSGGFGGGTDPVEVDAGAAGDVVRAVWLDLATVSTAQAVRDGPVSDPASIGTGVRPHVAVDEGRWLAAWVVTGRAADDDLMYATGGEDVSSGTLSRFESSANHPSPFYAPDGAVAWSERGAQSRVLVSGYQDAPGRRYVTRLRADPGRFAFIGLAAAALGVVTLPIMPWVFVSMLVAFYLTNRFIRTRLARGLARLSSLAGRSADEPAVKARIEAVSPLVWAAGFAVMEVGLLLAFLPSVGATVPLTFAGPVALSVAAGLGTGLVLLVAPQRSPWRIVALFAYFQTAALWATALPDVL